MTVETETMQEIMKQWEDVKSFSAKVQSQLDWMNKELHAVSRAVELHNPLVSKIMRIHDYKHSLMARPRYWDYFFKIRGIISWNNGLASKQQIQKIMKKYMDENKLENLLFFLVDHDFLAVNEITRYGKKKSEKCYSITD